MRLRTNISHCFTYVTVKWFQIEVKDHVLDCVWESKGCGQFQQLKGKPLKKKRVNLLLSSLFKSVLITSSHMLPSRLWFLLKLIFKWYNEWISALLNKLAFIRMSIIKSQFEVSFFNLFFLLLNLPVKHLHTSILQIHLI